MSGPRSTRGKEPDLASTLTAATPIQRADELLPEMTIEEKAERIAKLSAEWFREAARQNAVV